MDTASPLRRLYLGYLSRMYALMHGLSKRNVLGMRLATLARWLPILVFAFGWWRNWAPWLLVALLFAIVWLNYSLWRARRDNYSRFVPGKDLLMAASRPEPLPPNQKITLLATGPFSVTGRESQLLLSPASYWRVPLGDHIVMAEEAPGRYLYQFFDGATLQDVRSGWILNGREPLESVAVTFLARWGPEYTQFGQLHGRSPDEGEASPKRVTIYLTAEDANDQRAVWHSIVHEARQARQPAHAA